MQLFKLDPAYYLIILLALWGFALTFGLLKIKGNYNKLTKGQEGKNLGKILDEMMVWQEAQNKRTSEISSQVIDILKSAKTHFSKSALIRFNPFEDVGGDQSFVIALLDGANNGVVISSLHSRGTTRIYAKAVSDTKPVRHQFTKEEKEAVEKANSRG